MAPAGIGSSVCSCRSLKDFDANVTKQKLNKFPTEVKESDYMIMGLGESREIVRWAFNDAKKGDVAEACLYGW